MSNQTIYTALVKAGMSPCGACGLMGNMQAESAMRSNNAQDGMTRMSDEEYTAAVDNGTYGNFVRDSVGYGLCQWTYYTRKQNLLNYAKSLGVSIGDEAMQIQFAINELKSGYSSLWSFLCSTDSVYKAASRVCTEFERPAVNNIDVRAGYADYIFHQLVTLNVSTEDVSAATTTTTTGSECDVKLNKLQKGNNGKDVKALQILLIGNGYSCGNAGADGDFGSSTLAAVKKYQSAKGLTSDGIVGAKTWTKLLKG